MLAGSYAILPLNVARMCPHEGFDRGLDMLRQLGPDRRNLSQVWAVASGCPIHPFFDLQVSTGVSTAVRVNRKYFCFRVLATLQ